jgi:hypothetical protein
MHPSAWRLQIAPDAAASAAASASTQFNFGVNFDLPLDGTSLTFSENWVARPDRRVLRDWKGVVPSVIIEQSNSRGSLRGPTYVREANQDLAGNLLCSTTPIASGSGTCHPTHPR